MHPSTHHTYLKRGCTEPAPPRDLSFSSHFLAFFFCCIIILTIKLSCHETPLPDTSHSMPSYYSIMYISPISLFKKIKNKKKIKLAPKRCCMRLYAASRSQSQLKFDARNAVRLTVGYMYYRSNIPFPYCSPNSNPVRS